MIINYPFSRNKAAYLAIESVLSNKQSLTSDNTNQLLSTLFHNVRHANIQPSSALISEMQLLLLWLITLHATSSANDWVGGHNNNGFGIFMQCFLIMHLERFFWLQSYQTNIWDFIIYQSMRSVLASRIKPVDSTVLVIGFIYFNYCKIVAHSSILSSQTR